MRTIYIQDSVTKTCPFKSNVDLRREVKAVNARLTVRYTRVKGETYLPVALILTLSVMYRRVTHLLLRNKTYVIFV